MNKIIVNRIGSPYVVIVQQPDEIDLIINNIGPTVFSDATAVFAWTPSAVDGLRSKRMDYITAGDIFSEEFDYERKENFLLSYILWCRSLDKIINNNIQQLADGGCIFSPFVNQCIHKRHHVMNIVTELDCLITLRRNFGLSKIIFVYYEKSSVSPLSRASDMLERHAQWMEMFFKLNNGTLDLQDKNSWMFFRQFLPNYDLFRRTRSTVIRNWLRSRASDLLHGRKSNRQLRSLLNGIGIPSFSRVRENVLVFSSTEAEVEPILRSLNKICPRLNLVYWDQCMTSESIEDLDINVKRILNQFENESAITTEFHWDGIPLYSELKHEIERTLREDLNIIYRNIKYFLRLHQKYNFRLVISANTSSILEAILQQCEVLNIPRITSLHGGTVGVFKGRPDRLDWARSGGMKDYYFVYTETIRKVEQANIKYFGCQARPVAVGSNYFSMIRRNMPLKQQVYEGGVRVCYVSNWFSEVIDFKHGTASSATAYQLMLDVVSKLCDGKNLELSVKFGYDIETLQLDVTLLFPNVTFIPSSEKFVSIMNRFDIFLFPWLSTPFFEAVCGSRPILLYCDPRYEVLTDEAECCVKRAVTLVKSKSEFLWNIEELARFGHESVLLKQGKRSRNQFIENYIGEDKCCPTDIGANWIARNVLDGYENA